MQVVDRQLCRREPWYTAEREGKEEHVNFVTSVDTDEGEDSDMLLALHQVALINKS